MHTKSHTHPIHITFHSKKNVGVAKLINNNKVHYDPTTIPIPISKMVEYFVIEYQQKTPSVIHNSY